jgi:hypothetical protein
MILRPSESFSGVLHTATFAAGAANADSLPTAKIWKNGVIDAGVTVTVANSATGEYKLTGTIGAYTDGDDVALVATAIIGGLTMHETIWVASVLSASVESEGIAASVWAYATRYLTAHQWSLIRPWQQ